ncbi:MAG: hypothetical protein LC808_33970 [Actinobacteria bacterium]|nr:hypothetical protein [Actinomycetota bacterium]
MADPVIMLEVPFGQKDQAKAARWLAPSVRTDGPTIPASLLGQVNRCYPCTARGVALTGILVSPRYSLDPTGFISFDSVARTLAALVNDSPLAERYFTGRIPDAVQPGPPRGLHGQRLPVLRRPVGIVPLREDVTEFLAAGGTYEGLTIAELAFSVAGLPDLRSAWGDVDDDAYEDDGDDPDGDHVLTVPLPAARVAPAPVSPPAAVYLHPGNRPASVAERHRRKRPWRRGRRWTA